MHGCLRSLGPKIGYLLVDGPPEIYSRLLTLPLDLRGLPTSRWSATRGGTGPHSRLLSFSQAAQRIIVTAVLLSKRISV